MGTVLRIAHEGFVTKADSTKSHHYVTELQKCDTSRQLSWPEPCMLRAGETMREPIEVGKRRAVLRERDRSSRVHYHGLTTGLLRTRLDGLLTEKRPRCSVDRGGV
jgi:hypothetical protein